MQHRSGTKSRAPLLTGFCEGDGRADPIKASVAQTRWATGTAGRGAQRPGRCGIMPTRAIWGSPRGRGLTHLSTRTFPFRQRSVGTGTVPAEGLARDLGHDRSASRDCR
jgi:hypothetical protein